MTTDFKIDEIVILKNNEEREEIIAKNWNDPKKVDKN